MKDITGREYIYGISQDKNGAPYLFNIGELVRCKDCIHYESDGGALMVCRIDDMVVDDTDYCSYGERKGGEDE